MKTRIKNKFLKQMFTTFAIATLFFAKSWASDEIVLSREELLSLLRSTTTDAIQRGAAITFKDNGNSDSIDTSVIINNIVLENLKKHQDISDLNSINNTEILQRLDKLNILTETQNCASVLCR